MMEKVWNGEEEFGREEGQGGSSWNGLGVWFFIEKRK